ncbi:hypothetical protein AVE30378_06295 [Achromobacter veterisilvae]|uniref:N-acetyltransferase domain-containing protein n=1 Tax=Achromobacter veterisilvae TaxID=2069367 RepID=A0A446D1K8_9BURK|nr:hypothetical protein AVE30378_06295 [Achromobacter veterisilvae]
MTSPALTLRPATDDDLPFLLALRKATMTEHLRRAGAPDDDEHHLARIRHRFDDARIVWAADQPAGLFKTSRDADAWRVVQIQIAPPSRARDSDGACWSTCWSRRTPRARPSP